MIKNKKNYKKYFPFLASPSDHWRGVYISSSSGDVWKREHTALVEAVDAQDVCRTHPIGPADRNIAVRDGNNCRLPVSGEGIPVVVRKQVALCKCLTFC